MLVLLQFVRLFISVLYKYYIKNLDVSYRPCDLFWFVSIGFVMCFMF